MKVGFLHPGEMGQALAHGVRLNGHQTCWASAGRSAATRARAGAAEWLDLVTVDALAVQCQVLVSVCPSQAALTMAQTVARAGFAGLYIDVNPLAQARLQAMQSLFTGSGARFVDAALVGPPPVAGSNQTTMLLLSGPDRDEAAACLCREAQFPLAPLDLGDALGRASALKLCHSALHKGLLALQSSTWTLASRQGLLPALDALLMARDVTAHHVRARAESMRRVRPKAGRFAEEMDEWAALCTEQGLDPHFAEGAADIFRRMAALISSSGGAVPADTDRGFWAALADVDGVPEVPSK